MSEKQIELDMQTRSERSRSIEDAERFRALDTLKQLGLLIPVSDVETYHGRLGRDADKDGWQVDPSFSNASNDSGNGNVNSRSTLYTGERQVAEDFARERRQDAINFVLRQRYKEQVRGYTAEEKRAWLDRLNQKEKERWDERDEEQRKYYPKGQKVYTIDELDEEHMIASESRQLEGRLAQEEREMNWFQAAKDFRVEIHEIVSNDPDATILDLSFDITKLGAEDKARYEEALKALLIPITEGSPVGFEHRDEARPFFKAANDLHKSFLATEDVAAIVAEIGVDEGTAKQLAGAYNARQIASKQPSYLLYQLTESKQDIAIGTLDVNGEKREIPINLEYAERYLRLAHIVGVKQSIDSMTLFREITSISFIDLERTKTKETLEAERRLTWQKLGGIATVLSELLPIETMPRDQLGSLLQDAHVKPEELVAAARLIKGYDDIFAADAGNWEGFTLAEHTETVLRNFDENFADKIPVEFLAPMRLAILSHDVGKPAASANGEKHLQKKYNALRANDFLTRAGVDERLKGILLAVIGEGADLAYQINIRGAGEAAEAELESLARNTLSKFGTSDNIGDQVSGFIEMCKMLQISDGGAYTSMAITRKAPGSGSHRNAPSFNSSFAHTTGLGRRAIRLIQNGEAHAPHDLTPKAAELQSRVRVSRKDAGNKAPRINT